MLDRVPARPRGKPALPPTAPEPEPPARSLRRRPGQIVLVQQGGGAVGARRVGVYRALHEAGIEPDWIIGPSIGAIDVGLTVEAVFDDDPRRDSNVFAVYMWNPPGPESRTLWEAGNRRKDLRHPSRAHSHVARQRQVRRLRHLVAELARRLPEDLAADPDAKARAAHGCLTRMHVVRLLAPRLATEDHLRDVDFSPQGIRARAEAGYRHTQRVRAGAPWTREVDTLDGLVLTRGRGGARGRDAVRRR